MPITGITRLQASERKVHEMAVDVYLTIQELQKIFYDLFVSMFNSSPSQSQVRWSWPVQGAPAFRINDDVVFLKLYDTPGTMTTLREDKYSQEDGVPNMSTGYTRTLRLDCIFYGPNSWENAVTIRNKMFWQEHHDTLAASNLYMIPRFDPPRRIPELWQGQWYDRSDLSVSFNELVVLNRELPYIEKVPVGVYNRNGLVTQIDITPDE